MTHKNMTLDEFNKALETGAYAWPGGYPLYFICADGEALSFKAAQENAELIRQQIAEPALGKDWQVIAIDVNWEDASLYCAHTNTRIESAYAEDNVS